MFKLTASLLFITASTCFLVLSDTKGGVLTGERYFDRIGSAWQTTLYQDLELDSSGKIIRRVDYAYNSDGTLASTTVWNCTCYTASYIITRSYSYSSEYYGHTYIWTYTYDLDGKITAYHMDHDWWDKWGSYSEDHYDTYIYDREKLIQYNNVYIPSIGKQLFTNNETVYTYDYSGKLISEIKKFYDDWPTAGAACIGEERTLWTWDGNAGIGINEIFKNTVWINKGKTIRTVNEQVKPVTEYSSYWSWGNWIDQYEYVMQYVNEGVINRHYTNIYNPATKGYDLYKLHNYYYDNYGGMSAPGNLTVTVTGDSLKLNWFAVTGSSGYKVYSSDDPYDTFIEDTTGTFNGVEWTTPASAIRRFYRVTAVDSDK